MSALAKKMMEKYGWKEGEGLGKERSGMKSYVKVVRRDPHTATGLGHAADPAQGGSLASTHAVELDAIYGQLQKTTRKRPAKPMGDSDDDDEHSHQYDEDTESSADEKPSSSGSTSSGSSSTSDSGPPVPSEPTQTRATATKRSRRSPSSSSSSSSDSDEDEDDNTKRTKRESVGDVTRMSDKDLFQRCGGVRLGRAGRHRFFDGKLKRVHDSS